MVPVCQCGWNEANKALNGVPESRLKSDRVVDINKKGDKFYGALKGNVSLDLISSK